MITGKTKIIGIFGDPIEHTLSPIIHNEAFKHLKLDYCYVPFHVKREKLKDAVESIRALNLKGVNVTVPHKEAVIQYLDELSDEVLKIGAANTILNMNGLLKGFNTDASGFVMSLKEEGIELKGKNILLIGAGGAGKAVAYGCLKEGGKLYVFNRTLAKANELKEKFQDLGEIEVLNNVNKKITQKFNIIINATSLGLKEKDPLPINPKYLLPSHVFYDVVYPKTTIMREAEIRGCKTIGGLGMLIWQAVSAFEIWTEIKVSVQIFKKILKRVLTKY